MALTQGDGGGDSTRTASRAGSDGGGAATSARSAYNEGAGHHWNAMNQSRNNQAAESALPKMQLAGDPRMGPAGANIKEKGGSTSVSYPDGSRSTTKDGTTYYDQANGDRARSTQFPDGNSNNNIYRKNGPTTSEFDNGSTHFTSQYNQNGKLQQTETTSKATGQTQVEQAPVPDKQEGYDPRKGRGWDIKTNNRATI